MQELNVKAPEYEFNSCISVPKPTRYSFEKRNETLNKITGSLVNGTGNRTTCKYCLIYKATRLSRMHILGMHVTFNTSAFVYWVLCRTNEKQNHIEQQLRRRQHFKSISTLNGIAPPIIFVRIN